VRSSQFPRELRFFGSARLSASVSDQQPQALACCFGI